MSWQKMAWGGKLFGSLKKIGRPKRDPLMNRRDTNTSANGLTVRPIIASLRYIREKRMKGWSIEQIVWLESLKWVPTNRWRPQAIACLCNIFCKAARLWTSASSAAYLACGRDLVNGHSRQVTLHAGSSTAVSYYAQLQPCITYG